MERPTVVYLDEGILTENHPLQTFLKDAQGEIKVIDKDLPLVKKQKPLAKANGVILSDETTHSHVQGMLMVFNQLHDLLNGWVNDLTLTNQDIVCRLMDWLEANPRKEVFVFSNQTKEELPEFIQLLTDHKEVATTEVIREYLNSNESIKDNEATTE